MKQKTMNVGEELARINRQDRLYVLACGAGFTCLGFEIADRQARAVADWMKRPDLIPIARLGTRAHYAQHVAAMAAGAWSIRAPSGADFASIKPWRVPHELDI